MIPEIAMKLSSTSTSLKRRLLVGRPRKNLATSGDSSSSVLAQSPTAWRPDRVTAPPQRSISGHLNAYNSEANSRFFSSSVLQGPTSEATDPTLTPPSDIEKFWRQRTEQLLQIPVGTIQTSKPKWNEFRVAITWWIDNNYDTSVLFSLQLLQRFVEEERLMLSQAQNPNNEESEQSSGIQHAALQLPEYFNTDLLNLVVNRWRREIAMSEASKHAKSQISPSEMAEHLFRLHDQSMYLKPDARTMSMVIDASSYFNNPKEGVLLADGILQWMIDQFNDDPELNCHLRPNVFTFSSVMNVWVKSKQSQAPERVEELLAVMHEWNDSHPEWEVAPSGVTYATVIDSWAKRGNLKRVEELLYEMYEEFIEKGNQDLRPNIPCFNGYLVALAKRGDIDRAEEVLKQMHSLYEAGELDSRPSVVGYSTVLDCAAKSKSKHGAERAYGILKMMTDDTITPNAISYNSVLNAFARQGMVERAEEILQEMYQSYVDGNEELRPTSYSYSIVLAAWAKSRSNQAGLQGERILNLMKRLVDSGELETIDRVTYNTVLDCWAKSGSREAPKKAFGILEQMRKDGVSPDTYSYNIIFNICARNRKMKLAQAILNQMKREGVSADATTYNTLISGWSRQKERGSTDRAESIFESMKRDPNVSPDIFTFNAMLLCYSQTGNGPAAESLLVKMITGESGVKPNRRSFNSAIAAWSRSRNQNGMERAEAIFNKMQELGGALSPNLVSVNTVIGAWAKSGHTNAAEKCEELLSRARALRDPHGSESILPDVITYSSIINAWARSSAPDAAFRAEAVFRDLVEQSEKSRPRVKPNGRCFASLVKVWSQISHPEAGMYAEKYLRKIISLDASGDHECRPSTALFKQAIRAWKNSGDPLAIDKVESLITMLLEQVDQGNPFAKADIELFGIVLEVLLNAPEDEKAVRADRLISLMKSLQLKPNAHVLKLLQGCYESRDRQNSVSL